MFLEKEWRKSIKTTKQCKRFVDAYNLTKIIEFLENDIIPSEEYIVASKKELIILKEFATYGWKRMDFEERLNGIKGE